MLDTQLPAARVDARVYRPLIDARGADMLPPVRLGSLAKERRMLEGVLEDVARNFSEPVTLREICLARGYSVYQIIRTFRRLLGTTPHAYIMKMRIGHAAERLACGETIAGAAADAGFSDQSHMTRHFKRILGATPLQYVREVCAP